MTLTTEVPPARVPVDDQSLELGVLARMTESVAVYDHDARVVYWNPASEALLGHALADVRGKILWELFPEAVGNAFHQALTRVLRSGEPERFEHHYEQWDRWFENHVFPVPAGVCVVARDITLRKRLAGELKVSEAKFRHVFHSNMLGLLFSGPDANIVDANDAFLEMVGYDREDLKTGRLGWHTLTPPERARKSAWALEQLASAGVCPPFEEELFRKDGSRVSVLMGAALLNDVPGAHAVTYVLDVSDRKRQETALELLAGVGEETSGTLDAQAIQHAAARLATRSFADGCCVDLLLPDGRLQESVHVYANPESEQRAKKRRSERERGAEPFPEARALASNTPLLLRSSDGSSEVSSALYVPLRSRHEAFGVIAFTRLGARPAFDEQDVQLAEELARRLGLALDNARLFEEIFRARARADADLSDRQRLESALFVQARLTHIITESASAALFALDDRQHCTFMNPAAERMTGFSFAELQALHQPLHDIIHHQHPDGSRFPIEDCPIARALSTRRTQRGEAVFIHKDQRLYPVAYTASPLIEDGQAVGSIIEVRDITEEKRHEREIRESEERFRNMAEHAPVMLWVTNAQGSCVYLNKPWCDFTGYEREQALGSGWLQALHPADVKSVEDCFVRGNARRESFAIEYRLQHADKEFRSVIDSASPRFGAQGEFLGFIGSVIDITDRKRAAERVALIARASSSFALSADVASVLSNALGAFLPDFADLAAVYLEDQGTLHVAALSCVDRESEPLLRALFEKVSGFETTHGLMHVLVSGQPALVSELDPAFLDELARRDPAHAALLRELDAASYLAVPLVQQGGPRGVLALASRQTGRRYKHPDVAVSQEVARRIATAMDNVRLFELAQAERLRAEEANRAKDEFLAVVSHELRTPLNAILGFATLLTSGRLNGDAERRAVDTIHRNARAQAQLIDDILDVSRIITGKLRIDVAPVNLERVISAAVDVVRHAAESKGIQLQAIVANGTAIVMGDADRLQQVVWNLISNAVKFTPRGGRVVLRLERRESASEITVEDSGQGLAPESLPFVFERFWQVEMSSARTKGGLGLGLAIVKHIVELHGGTISARSEGLGRGSTFSVRLPTSPLRQSDPPLGSAPGPALRSELEQPPSLDRLRVLVVDDEPDARDLLVSLLEQCGATVLAADSAAAALAVVPAQRPDLIISDVGMPGEDGYSLLEKVRALPSDLGGQTPAIALTAYARAEDRTRALLAGFDMHVSKPIEPSELVVVVATVAGRLTGRRRERRPEKP